jgi:type I restriction enzyme S subunit
MGKWVKKKLGEVIIDSYAGGTPNRNREDFFGGEIPWVTSGEVNNPEIISTMENITEAGIKGSSAKWIPENSILVALYGATAGQVSMLKIKATSNQAVLAIIPNNEIIDTDFLHNQICFNKQNLLFLAQGSGQPNLSKNIVDRLPISYPSSLPEQRRIASILSQADKVIDSTQKLIAKYKQIKQGMMEDLLKPKEGWKKVKFDNFFEMLPNNTLSREDLNSQGGSFQNIHYGDVLIKYPYCLDCNIHEIPYINRDVKFNSTKAIDGDVIFADTAEDDTVGKCVELINVGDRKIVSGLHTYLCRPKFKMSVGYLGYFLNSNVYHNQLLPYIAGSKVSSVNRKSIAQTYICFPDLSEQCRIASILSGIDKKIESEEKVLEKYKKIKKGLMEKLLNCE